MAQGRVESEMDASESEPAGDVDYDKFGKGYASKRQSDPRIERFVHQALGNAKVVLNVGAGAGSYEPSDRHVIAIEPSVTMRAQRPANRVPAIHGMAENLPLEDQSVDAAMAIVTVHQWRDLEKGLQELCRVTRGPILIMTFDGAAMNRYWLSHYAPDLFEHECRRMPRIETLSAGLGDSVEVHSMPIPSNCVDGFNEAYYARPEAFLDAAVRRSQSAWSFVSEEDEAQIVKHLGDDLKSGRWDKRFGEWRSKPSYDGSLRLIVSRASGRACAAG